MPKSALYYDMMADLKNAPVDTGTVVLLVGKNAIGDGLGGFYRFDGTSSATEDLRFLNVIASNRTVNGRWLRVFQRATVLPNGVLVNNGGVKTAYLQGTTDNSGRITVYATTTGAIGGAALFTEVWQTAGDATVGGNAAVDAVTASRVSISTDLKTIVYQFSQGNTSTLGNSLASLLNLTMNSLKAASSLAATVVVTGT